MKREHPPAKPRRGRRSRELAVRVERIAHYESLLDALQSALEADAVSPETASIAKALSAYYAGDDWKGDFASDEAGLLPLELKRGVLSEDGIYNALEAWRERLEASE